MIFINELPDGLNTIIGDNAARLSVGQAQRIAVARAPVITLSLFIIR